MSEPTSEQIQAVVDFTSITAAEAARYLRAKHNSIEAAVNAIFDGEKIEELEQGNAWDDSVWGTDREGNQNLTALGRDSGPSRRPSPAPSLALQQPKNKTVEDEELEQALAASMALSNQQETGFRKADGTEVKFGPATKEYYESSQWALVPSTAQEVVPDVPIEERAHKEFEPRVLKHLPDDDYTPNFISICRSIPLTREALMSRAFANSDLGYEPDWWRGAPIPKPRIVHVEDGSHAEPDQDKYSEFIMEVQRLMAVLDSSERSYASIGALTQTEMIRDTDLSAKPGSLLELFLQSWIKATSGMTDNPEEKEQYKGVFNTVISTNAKEGMTTPDITVMDMSVNLKGDEKAELCELLDNLLWNTDPNDDDMADNYIETPAQVFVMKLSHSDPESTQLGVLVPSSIHLDKYMKDNIAASRGVRQRMADGKRRMAKIDALEQKLKFWPPSKNNKTQLDARQMLKHSHDHFSGQNRKDADKSDTRNGVPLANSIPSHYPDIAKQLEHITISIDEKLKRLAEEKEKTRKVISEMSKSHPSELGEFDPRYHYTLRGIATKPNITYILQARDPADRSSPPQDESTPEGYQWWRVEYEVSGFSAKLTTIRGADYDVIRAAELEHNSALLVYAADGAEDVEDDGLPSTLADFVSKDNEAFRKDFAAAKEQQHDPPAYQLLAEEDIAHKSIERRISNDSMEVLHEGMTAGDALGRSETPDEFPAFRTDDQHPPSYGLGYGLKDPPVAEIRLDESDELPDEPSGMGEEMVETSHQPLLRPAVTSTEITDTAMHGAESQDAGAGGNASEDVAMK